MINKTSLNKRLSFSKGNIKSKCTDDVIFLTWSLPSRKTCPYSTELCRKRCFAKKNETFKTVVLSRERNLEETYKDTFVNDIIQRLGYELTKVKNKKIFVRIHTSGDFYSLEYFKKWVEIAQYFKKNDKILFQCYTKSLIFLIYYYADLFKQEDIYDTNDIREGIDNNELNIHIVYSIWKDTDPTDIELAKEFGLQTFTALPKNEIDISVNNGSFLCNGDCGNCKECYTGNSKSIVIPYH